MILIDFDGTIVDLWPRYHAVFCELTKADITIDSYKTLKKKIKRDGDIAEYLGFELPHDYFEKKAVYLEDRYFLSKDKLLLPIEQLAVFAEENEAVVLTKRRNPENFFREFKTLCLEETKLKRVCTAQPKIDWIKENIKKEAVIIGDDVRDLQAAALPNINAVMVLSGLGTEADFSKSGIEYKLCKSLEEYINDERSNLV